MKSVNSKVNQQETQLKYLEKVKKLAIIAMFSDDELMNMLVLKGGNAIDLIYKASARASIDVDFSIENEFDEKGLKIIANKIQKLLEETYEAESLKVFDIKFNERPSEMIPELRAFWGGYKVEFKIMPKSLFEKNSGDIDALRREASVIGPRQVKTFTIDISKFEYCKDKQKKDLAGYTIYVYSPAMLAIEKIRAICQQMQEYREIVKTMTISPRPKDFFDIYILIEHFAVDLNEKNNIDLLKGMFEVKKVPLSFLHNIEKYRDFHAEGFSSLKDTVKPGMILQEFEFYFNYVLEKVKKLPIY